MKILDNLNQKAIISKLNATDKNGVLNELSTALAEASGGNQEEMMRVLLDRERLGSTGIGGGIAIPHGKMKSVVISRCLPGYRNCSRIQYLKNVS